MVLFPGQWHTYYPYVQTGWNEYYIGFEGAVIDDMVKGGFLSKENQVLEVGLNEELVSLFSRALEIAEALIRSGAIDVIVVDSVAALVPISCRYCATYDRDDIVHL